MVDWSVGASRLRVGVKVEARNGQGLDNWRPMQYAQGLGGVFEWGKRIGNKCVHFDRLNAREWTLLTYHKLKIGQWMKVLCDWRYERNTAHAVDSQKLWQARSLSDLAGEHNTSSGRPLVIYCGATLLGFQGGWNSCDWGRMKNRQRKQVNSHKVNSERLAKER